MASRTAQIVGHLAAPAELVCDFLVVGAGASGLGFSDALLLCDPSATVVCVDRLAGPGGHWNDAYPFVRLHQPSGLYGACSLPLGTGFIETAGHSAGMAEMASGAECLAYFDKLLRTVLLPTKRFTYLPMHELDWVKLEEGGEGCEREAGTAWATNLVTRKPVKIVYRRRLVDSTHAGVTVPSTRPPPFALDDGVDCIDPSKLPTASAAGAVAKTPRICIVGAGKTGIDAMLFLLDRGVEPDKLTFVVPRDQFFYPRESLNPTVPAFLPLVGRVEAATRQAVRTAKTPREFLDQLEAAGALVRLDDDAPYPTMFHGATVTASELDAMRTVRHVVRKGRIRGVTRSGMDMEGGHEPMPSGTLYVDCTNDTNTPRPSEPVFRPGRITVQGCMRLHPTFSAALIGHLATTDLPDARRNAMTRVVPHADRPWEVLTMRLDTNRNAREWMRHRPTRDFLAGCRLFGGWLRNKPAKGEAGDNVAGQVVAIADEEDAPLAALVEMARRGEGL
ncbi:pyridine nucleotide-disulfide oxidoreductase-domain-containing protein [Hyaloraphidium curvatum]|nr:pyridine nucleotide-disulfide oxidoreductase-domain-containing protein [Hyaloraphidium curvatum]